MSLHLVTGHSGKAHISAADMASFNAGAFGSETYVFPGTSAFELTVESNNRVNIQGGEMMMQGRFVRMPYGETASIDIANGTSGVSRADLIVIRYLNDTDTGVESVEFAVIQGNETEGTPVLPAYQTGDLTSGGCLIHEEPLYKIPINGLTIGTPEKLFKIGKPSLSPFGDTMFGTLILKRMFGDTAETGGLFPSAYTIGEDRSFAITRTVNDAVESMLFFNKNGLGLFDAIDEEYSYFSRVVTGTYAGDSEASQFIDLGFTPTAVIVMRTDGFTSGYDKESGIPKYSGGLATKHRNVSNWVSNTDYPVLTIEENGFKVYYTPKTSSHLWGVYSNAGSNFSYIAWR